MGQAKISNQSVGAEVYQSKKKNEKLVEVSNELQTHCSHSTMLHVEDTIKKFDASFVDMMKKAEEKNMMNAVCQGIH